MVLPAGHKWPAGARSTPLPNSAHSWVEGHQTADKKITFFFGVTTIKNITVCHKKGDWFVRQHHFLNEAAMDKHDTAIPGGSIGLAKDCFEAGFAEKSVVFAQGQHVTIICPKEVSRGVNNGGAALTLSGS